MKQVYHQPTSTMQTPEFSPEQPIHEQGMDENILNISSEPITPKKESSKKQPPKAPKKKTQAVKRIKEQTESTSDYAKMSVAELKKILEERKMDGRSKLTKKDTIIKALEFFDQDPEDKHGLKDLITEIGTPKKVSSTKKEEEEKVPKEKAQEEKVPKKKDSTKSKKEKSDKSSESTKPKKPKKTIVTTSDEEEPVVPGPIFPKSRDKAEDSLCQKLYKDAMTGLIDDADTPEALSDLVDTYFTINDATKELIVDHLMKKKSLESTRQYKSIKSQAAIRVLGFEPEELKKKVTESEDTSCPEEDFVLTKKVKKPVIDLHKTQEIPREEIEQKAKELKKIRDEKKKKDSEKKESEPIKSTESNSNEPKLDKKSKDIKSLTKRMIKQLKAISENIATKDEEYKKSTLLELDRIKEELEQM